MFFNTVTFDGLIDDESDNFQEMEGKDKSKILKAKAKNNYLRGRALNIGSEFSIEAEALLSKAVKLEPTLVEAWNELGESYWKKNDLESARTCFETALKHVSI